MNRKLICKPKLNVMANFIKRHAKLYPTAYSQRHQLYSEYKRHGGKRSYASLTNGQYKK